jgi:hypothetical protein
MSMCRQIEGTADHVGERFAGTKGTTDAVSEIRGASTWRYEGEKKNPYVQEHADLVSSIRAGAPLNEGRQVAEATLSAIMGREAAYTGQVITWDELLAAPQSIAPPKVVFGELAVPPVAMPGRTKLRRRWSDA